MMRFTQDQLEVFDRRARANFYHRLAAYLREVMPEQTAEYDNDALLAFIEESARRASLLRIETESGIAQWTCLALTIGLGFDDDPEMRKYFKTPGMGPEERLEVLVDGLNNMLFGSHEEQG